MNISTGVGAIAPTHTLSPVNWGRGILKSFSNKGKTILNESPQLTSTPIEDSTFEVNLVDGETICVDLDRLRQNSKYIHGDILIQDVIKYICKRKEIAPSNAGFFGIKCEFSSGTSTWIVQTKMVKDVKQEKKKKFHFRLQFKVLFGQELRKRDSNAYDYYLKQCRCDFKSGVFSKQLEGKDNEKILLRIVILEMMMLYHEVSKEEKVHHLKDMLKHKYRKYFSIDEILKKYYDKDGPRDMTRCRQKVEKSLNCFAKVTEPDKDFMTEIELLKNFRDEIFVLHKYERAGTEANQVELWIAPKDVQKKVLVSNIRQSLWESSYSQLHQLKFCELDQKKGEIKIMIIRGDEPPEVMYCPNEQVYESLCSFTDGYYRLLVNQYNSILHETSQCLLRSPCFGPIHRDVAARILSNKGVERGTYLIREHTKHYGSYVLSLISDEHDFLHIEILREEEDNKKFYSCGSKNFDTLEDLCKFYGDPKNSDEIKGTLTARIHPKQAGSIPLYTDPANFRPIIADRHSLSKMTLLPVRPPPSQIVMLDDNDITENKPIKVQGTFGKVNISHTRDGRELVVKRLENIQRDELLDLYSVLKATQLDCIVALVGISLNDMFLAYEYLPIGSLEEYLIEKRNNITYGVLLRYLMQITDAIEFLHSKNCVHGDLAIANIYMQDANNIKVGNGCVKWKLASFKKSMVDIISNKRFNFQSPEIILNESCEYTEESDVWAFGLTVWQLFTLEQPFRNYNYEQLRVFFTQHMDNKIAQQPGLIHLNMHNLPFCTDEMFDMLNSCLRMEHQHRSSMEKVKCKVINEILKKAASKDKKKCYFTHDWKDQTQYNDIHNLLQQNNNHPFPTDMKKHSLESDDYTTEAALSMKNGESLVPDLSIVKSEVSDMDTSFCGNDINLSQDLQVSLKTTNGSHSAPSSPTRPKLYRSNSLNERGDEDRETALILLDISKQNEKLKRSQSVTKGIKPEINQVQPSSCMLSDNPAQSFNTNNTPPFSVSNEIIKDMREWTNVNNITTQSACHVTSHFSHLGSHPASLPTSNSASYSYSIVPTSPLITSPSKIQSNSQLSTHDSLSKESERRRFSQSHIPPPDSPEAVRREYVSEHNKRDLPKNDRTRLYLQERINKERDRFHGKRSLSFTDEFEEYKNNTIRAAKRALLGPNPFNIGIQLPDDFLLRTDKRMCQAERTLPPDVKRYFTHLPENNRTMESYIPVSELKNRNKTVHTDMKMDSNDPREALCSRVDKMHTHSPGPPNCEDKNNFSVERGVTNTNVNTHPLIAQHPMRFPYQIPLSNPTSKSPKRTGLDAKYIPQYPYPYPPIDMMREPLPVNLSKTPWNFPVIPAAQRPVLPISQSGARLINPVRSVNPVPTVPSPQNHEDRGHYEASVGPMIPSSYEGFRKIDKSSLETLEKLGTGAFGEVWKGIWKFKINKTIRLVNVAIKRLIASDEPDYKKAVEDIHAEAKHLATLSNGNDTASQHIIKLYGLCSDDREYQIVEEFATYGQLDSYIERNKELITDGDILNYCKQVAVGMDYMHKMNVIHRDLACRNILVIEHRHIKISDFGMSRQPNKEYYRVRDVEKAKVPIRWCALESITKSTYTRETDCWSYGVAAWEMYTVFRKDYHQKRAKPYEAVEDVDLIAHLDKGNRLPQPVTCPNEIWIHISACWHVDSRKRPLFPDFIRLFNKTMKEIGYET